jgi:cytochrome c peroxidase
VHKTSIVFASLLILGACQEKAPSNTTESKPTGFDERKTSATKASQGASDREEDESQPVLAKMAYHPEMEMPARNPLTAEKIELGKHLFFDKRLGKDGKFSCESCHYVDKGWADANAVSIKANGKANARHSPALWNVGYQRVWYWDGRARSLEAQVLAAWKGQMGAGNDTEKHTALVAKLPGYQRLFKAAFGAKPIVASRVVDALASFVRSIRSGNAPFDKFEQGDKKAISPAAARGWELFRNKAGCAACHAPPLFTDFKYHNVGVGYDKPEPDTGRAKVTKKAKDEGKFKTPALRSVSTHPPYLHNGSAKTLAEAVDYMLSGGHTNPNLDGGFKKVDLSKEQRAELVAFLKSLTPAATPFEKPKLP